MASSSVRVSPPPSRCCGHRCRGLGQEVGDPRARATGTIDSLAAEGPGLASSHDRRPHQRRPCLGRCWPVITRLRTTALVGGLLVAVLGLAGCATQPGMHDGRSTYSMHDADAAGGAGLVGGSADMMPGGPMASGEQEFLVTMVAHHREAIGAAGQLARSARPELRRFGRHIIRAQAHQVLQMRGWLDRWYSPAPVRDHYRPMMRDLSPLVGDDLDRTFLVDMIRHHMMAVMMSRHLMGSGMVQHRPVARLTDSIAQGQTAEIALMRRWLTEWAL